VAWFQVGKEINKVIIGMNARHTETNVRSIARALLANAARQARLAGGGLQNPSIGGLFKAFVSGNDRQYLGLEQVTFIIFKISSFRRKPTIVRNNF
jgi:hypothetical protein